MMSGVPLSTALGHTHLNRRRLKRLALLSAFLAAVALTAVAALVLRSARWRSDRWVDGWLAAYPPAAEAAAAPTAGQQAVLDRLAAAAEGIAGRPTRYDPAYVVIDYPGGDVPPETGVCTDLVVRAFRDVGVDLQRDVHDDMAAHFDAYPTIWRSSIADSNIDHRRVPNLMAFFARHGEALPISPRAPDYRPGDVVAWDLGGGWTHIGIVTASRAVEAADRYLVAHHVGGDPGVDDVLFRWPIVGHFRYYGRSDVGARP